MSYKITDFVGQATLAVKTARWYRGNRANELNAIASALATDPTTQDATLQRAPAGLIPGQRVNTSFTNDLLRVINKGKAGHLTPLAMGNAITAALAKIFPPVQTSAPAISGAGTVGSTLTATTGNWTYSPTFYTYQWRRGVTNVGANQNTYVSQAADSGSSITMQLTAHNAAGSTQATLSNAIAIT